MKSTVIKRSVIVAGHKTSISLEDAFWKELKAIALGRDTTVSKLIGKIDSARQHGNLSSAIRLFVLDSFTSSLPDRAERRNSTHEIRTDVGGRFPSSPHSNQ
jgi:predicted DNA-binding ribbon-helix-helix protein